MAPKILIADDEEDFLEIRTYNLHKEGFDVIAVTDGQAALDALSERPNFIVLDIMMPELGGYEVCKTIRDREVNTPVLFLSARDSDFDEVQGFESGVDDYITKLFIPIALLARIRSHLSKSSQEKTLSNLGIGDPILDMENYSVTLRGQSIEFTKTDFNVLAFLLRRPNMVHTRESLLTNVWGVETYVADRTVNVHVGKIRKKRSDYGEFIETKPRMGYRFNTQRVKHADQA